MQKIAIKIVKLFRATSLKQNVDPYFSLNQELNFRKNQITKAI